MSIEALPPEGAMRTVVPVLEFEDLSVTFDLLG